MVAPAALVSGAALDIGRNPKRTTNQDQLAVFEPVGADCKDYLYLVCDGMGGHHHGEVASKIAVEAIPRAYHAARKTASIEEALRLAIQEGHQAIKVTARRLERGDRMGTTAVVAAISGQQLTVANVGDSRAYIIHSRQIRQITRDHSRAKEILERGSKGGNRHEPGWGRHILTRSLTAGRESVEPDIFTELFQEGDALVLCSDGLWGCVSESSVVHMVTQVSPAEAATKLTQMANRAGGKDNISIIVVRKGAPGAELVEDDTGEIRHSLPSPRK